MGTMQIMGGDGDTRVAWDPGNADETAAARAQFDTLRGKGYLAFRVRDAKDDKGEQIHVFDPQAGRIILSPPLRGGQ